VPVLSLDGYLAHAALRPNLVKIDVEGAEWEVLRGAQRMLLEARPIVLVEIHDRGADHRTAVLQILDSCGYGVNMMGTRGRETFCVAVPRPAGKSVQLAPA
jgi:hypothetical protein